MTDLHPSLLVNCFRNLTNIDKKDITLTVINEATSGSGPTKKNYQFESLEKMFWPNVIALEYGVNLNYESNFAGARDLDTLIHFIKQLIYLTQLIF